MDCEKPAAEAGTAARQGDDQGRAAASAPVEHNESLLDLDVLLRP